MLSPFIPSASTPSARPADQTASHKVEAAAPAAGATFHELLAHKANAAAAHSQAPAHANLRSKAQAQSHHNANAHAEARMNARPETTARDNQPSKPAETSTEIGDKLEKPVDHSINRRLAKSSASSAVDKPSATSAADNVDTTGLLGKNTVYSEDVNGEATITDKNLSETALDHDQAQSDLPVMVPILPALGLPVAPLAPVTLGLPTVVAPAPTEKPESAETSVAAIEMTMAEGNSQPMTSKSGSPTAVATSKARVNPATTAASPASFTASPATFDLSPVAAPVEKALSPATNSLGLGVTPQALIANEATSTDTVPVVTNSASAGTTSETSDATANAANQANARQGANAYGPAAQIADSTKAVNFTASDSSAFKIKNSNQPADFNEDKKSSMTDGIRRAYELPSMSSTAPVFQAPTATVQTLGPVNPNSPVAPTLASTAVRMVEKVSEVAEHLASHPAEKVTVRIDLDATHRVDVHVSMRGGQVHADFRSDSADMRMALASAWKEFSQGREGSDRRWAEPAFATMAAPVAGSSSSFNQQSVDSAASYGPGQESANRQASEREAQAQALAKPSRAAVRAPAPATVEVKTPIVRSENSQHLSVLA